MKKGLTEIVFILDKSGSMSGLEADTIGGYNSFLEKQKKVDGEAYVSTVLFSDRNEVVHDSWMLLVELFIILETFINMPVMKTGLNIQFL